MNLSGILLSACIIVRDEEDNLPGCLGALRQVADEVVVYDTGSLDRTVEVARALGADVVEGYWDDDFSRARNAALAHCRGVWVLHVDADEILECEAAGLRAALERSRQADAFAVNIYNLTGDGSQEGLTHRALRIFRRAECHWRGRVHEQVVRRHATPDDLRTHRLDDVLIVHSGYLDAVMHERGKLARNLMLASAAVQESTGQAGAVAALHLARSLAAHGRHLEAAPHFSAAVDGLEGAPAGRRMALLHGIECHIVLGEMDTALAWCDRLELASAAHDIPRFYRAMVLRRTGHLDEAIAQLDAVNTLRNDDGYAMPDGVLQGEKAAALLDAGRMEAAAHELLELIECSGDPLAVVVAAGILHEAGRSLADIASAVSEAQLLRACAALTVMDPDLADEVATGLCARFGDRPQILAASIRFAPHLKAPAALEWAIRIRSIGMHDVCPLIARARMPALAARERLRAAATASAAFADGRAPDLVLAAARGLDPDEIPDTLVELAMLVPDLAVGDLMVPDPLGPMGSSSSGWS